jgi:hypothetical protein
MTETNTKPRNNRIPLQVWIFCAVILADLWCATSAKRMPYMLNIHKYWFYYACAFPGTLAFFSYFVFFRKWGKAGQTMFEMRHSGGVRGNLKRASFEFAIMLVISAAFAWMSWGVVACGAEWFSKEPFSKTYKLVSLTDRGTTGVDFGLVDTESGSKYLVKQSRSLFTAQSKWEINSSVCAQGRASGWGAMVEDLKAGGC